MLSRCQVLASSCTFIRSSFSLLAISILALLAASAGAQTQASCQFVKFNTRFSVNNGHRVLEPSGVNDNGTVVGAAYHDVDLSVRGFTRSPNGSITYYKRNTPETYFMDRSDSDIIVGVTGPAFSPGTTAGTPFFLKGSTFTPFTMTIGGTTYKKFTVWSINRWGTTVGAFTDSSGKKHGFKRFSDGKAIRLDFPGSAQTEAMAINDNGTIVGYFSKTASPNL